MAPYEGRLRRFIFVSAILSLFAVGGISVSFPLEVSTQWFIAFFTLLALAIASAVMALTVTESGASTAVDFLPHLAAILLLGPTGAVFLTLVEQVIAEFLILRKPRDRAAFNVSQFVLATAIAALLFNAFGGIPSLEGLSFRTSFPPFMIGVLGYFTFNSLAVSWAISIIEGRPFWTVWRQAAGGVFVFDVVMSSLAYLIAVLYGLWGPVALLAAIVPMIGLRYSYGVNIELQQLNQDLLRVLVKTLEARDRYTSGHSVRVAESASAIAKELGLRGKRLRHIETGALLHDIGKIDLAYGEILRQTGPLTPEQRELIRAHPDKGVEIVSQVRSLDSDVLGCIRHHHEWFDGSGYPTGIAGEDIPIGARIIMISDSVDAMLTDRPYRKALDREQVRQELLRNSGKQFDPMVVEAALNAGVLDSIYEAKTGLASEERTASA